MTRRRRNWTLVGITFTTLLLNACNDCDDVCAELEEFTRVPCAAPPYMLCNTKGEAAKPLNATEVAYLREKCGSCNSCGPCSSLPKSK